MREIYREVRNATALGESTVTYTVNYTVSTPTSDAIRNRLERKGFRVEIDHRSGTSNMGDSAAPCNVDWTSTDVKIAWGKDK